jgi:hypothetical protein
MYAATSPSATGATCFRKSRRLPGDVGAGRATVLARLLVVAEEKRPTIAGRTAATPAPAPARCGDGTLPPPTLAGATTPLPPPPPPTTPLPPLSTLSPPHTLPPVLFARRCRRRARSSVRSTPTCGDTLVAWFSRGRGCAADDSLIDATRVGIGFSGGGSSRPLPKVCG